MVKRRDVLTAGAGLGAAVLLGDAAALAQSADAPPARPPAAAGGRWDDGLARPIPYTPHLGTGKARGLVLGGGGIYLASWMAGYFRTLKAQGVDVAEADIAVGTSAGSLVGAVLLGGRLEAFASELEELGANPALFARLIPDLPPNPSQIRARRAADDATEATPEAIQGIGRAAMAARNPAGPADYFASVKAVIGETAWPSPNLHTTANDCYTGERIVVSQDAGIAISHACAASSSLPGSMGPTWLDNRLCMDGGICQTSTHCDVVAGVRRALVVSLSDGGADAVRTGLRTSGLPNTLDAEIAALRSQGTEVILKVVGLMPGTQHVDSIMDPKWIAPCLRDGHERALADAAELTAFWNG
ncbi:patatin-like phospholipase family protein [Amaricoccus sp.]|uniref:patatin-like phospholipase family protein n=1 Tax=Amaricoccus sp. TaxID=1872485 RepID=UPI001B3E897C|nr:patatin-like phospholipase family protein [Amaricoccus sp.]MBP7001903.1 patatin-like phospholipase family protein [Amaricoccus sp.]